MKVGFERRIVSIKKSMTGYSFELNPRHSDCVDTQADLSLSWVRTHFVGFVMSWLSFYDCFCTVVSGAISMCCQRFPHLSRREVYASSTICKLH